MDDVSGIILFRPTVSPIVFKQQIGRALTVGKKDAVILDIVDNISSLYNWQEHLAQLRAYQNTNGNLGIPGTYVTGDGFQLGRWYAGMKRQYRNGTLPEEKRKDLEQVGILWSSVHFGKWMKHYQEAVSFYRENGHLNIPQSFVTADGFHLAVWVSGQRQKRAKGELTDEQISLMEKLGVLWEPADTRWEEGFRALQAYQKRMAISWASGFRLSGSGIGAIAWAMMRFRRWRPSE